MEATESAAIGQRVLLHKRTQGVALLSTETNAS